MKILVFVAILLTLFLAPVQAKLLVGCTERGGVVYCPDIGRPCIIKGGQMECE